MIYLICFAASAACAELANREKDRKKILLYSAASILITALLAGLRDYSIGIDTENYLVKKEFWGGASSYPSLGEYLSYYAKHGSGEYLSALLLGVIAQFFGSYSLYLFVAHTVIVGGIYIGAYRMRRYANPALVLLLFYLFYYNQSLNILRQYMAMAVVFAALPDVPARKYVRFSLAVLVASLIHKSALLSFAILLLVWFLKCDLDRIVKLPGKASAFLRKHFGKAPARRPERTPARTPARQKTGKDARSHLRDALRLPDPFTPTIPQRQLILFVGLLLLVVIFNPLCRLCIALGIIPEKYSFYVDFSKVDYNILSTLFLLVEMACLLFLHKYLRRKIRCFDFFFANTVSYLALQQLTFFLVYGRRIAAYFSLANLITIAMMPRVYKDWTKRVMFTMLIIFVAAVYWMYVYMLRNASETFPYQFVF